MERPETARETVLEPAAEDGAPLPEPLPPGHREIPAPFDPNGDGLRARDVCRTWVPAPNRGTPKTCTPS